MTFSTSRTAPRYRSMAALAICGISLFGFSMQAESAKPRLILQITVDQLRGDLPTRYYDRLGSGGFRYLWERGTVYRDAHHAHANTETIVGHTTLATGAHPALHGMVGNVWLDRHSDQLTYNIEDADYRLLTTGADVDKATEIDPTQRVARSEGRSPRAIRVSTFSDELAINSNGQAKLFGVSIKDRGAVAMAGHAGKAFWFSKASGEFVSSSYYFERYPQWVVDWNKQQLPQSYADKRWELSAKPSSYLFGNADDQAWETDLAGFGRTFPHPYGPGDGKYFTTLLTISPAGDELTTDFAKRLISEESLGQDSITDFLSVSYSSTDYVGHIFGPASLESEDNLLRLDRSLAKLLAHVDKVVGLQHTLIVLSADHGGPEAPGSLQQLGIDAGYVDPDSWDRQPALQRLKRKFELGDSLIERYAHPYIYLDQEAIAASGQNPAEVEQAVIDELLKFPGVVHAVSSTALRTARVPDTALNRAIRHNFSPARSGDIYVVFAPNWFINDFDGLEVASTHGSPWAYDTYVPIVFAGTGIPSQQVYRRVHTIDIAPTLALLAGTKPPSGAMGQPLVEVFSD